MALENKAVGVSSLFVGSTLIVFQFANIFIFNVCLYGNYLYTFSLQVPAEMVGCRI